MAEERYVITDKVKCSACGAPLWKERDNWYPAAPPELMYNTLVAEFRGGYNMFYDVDPCGEAKDHELTLCHDCAHKLVGSSPFLTRLMKGGHFHGFTSNPLDPLCECISDFDKDWGKL